MTDVIRVVLFDDHTLFRMGLAELLERHGKVSVVAMSGKPSEAAQLLDEHHPDVAVLDLNMPGTDGITLLRQLREAGYTLPFFIAHGERFARRFSGGITRRRAWLLAEEYGTQRRRGCDFARCAR